MNSELTDFAEIVLTTTSSADDADRLAAQLVNRGLAACVQVDGPIKSVYRWEGQVQTCDEWRLMVKTTREMADQVCTAISELHDYDEPEILRVPIRGGSLGYLQWIREQVRSE